MLVVTYNSVQVCSHEVGLVVNTQTQNLVGIAEPSSGDKKARERQRILVEADPVGRPIVGCPNVNIGILPCKVTLGVKEGYSELLRIEGRRVCLESLTGPTDGSPGTFRFRVRSSGQSFVRCGV